MLVLLLLSSVLPMEHADPAAAAAAATAAAVVVRTVAIVRTIVRTAALSPDPVTPVASPDR